MIDMETDDRKQIDIEMMVMCIRYNDILGDRQTTFIYFPAPLTVFLQIHLISLAIRQTVSLHSYIK